MASERWNELARARTLIELGRYAQARDLLEPLVAAEPDDADALRQLARAHLELDDGIRGLQAAQASLMVEPNDPQGHVLASGAYANLGRTQDAIDAAQRAVEADSSAWWTWTTFARALSRDPEQRTDAWLAAMAAVERSAHEPTVHRTVGDVASDLGWTEKARAAYEAALALDPADAGTLNNLARLQLLHQNEATAATGFMSALAADPHSGVPADNLVLLAQRMTARACAIALLSSFILGWTLYFETPLDLAGWPGPFRFLTGAALAATMYGLSVVPWRRLPEDVQNALRAAATTHRALRRAVQGGFIASGAVLLASVLPVLPALVLIGIGAVTAAAALLAGVVGEANSD